MKNFELVSEETRTILKEKFNEKSIVYQFSHSSDKDLTVVLFHVVEGEDNVVNQTERRISGLYLVAQDQLQPKVTNYQDGDALIFEQVSKSCKAIVTNYANK